MKAGRLRWLMLPVAALVTTNQGRLGSLGSLRSAQRGSATYGCCWDDPLNRSSFWAPKTIP